MSLCIPAIVVVLFQLFAASVSMVTYYSLNNNRFNSPLKILMSKLVLSLKPSYGKCLHMYVIAFAGLLALSGLQASCWSEGFSRESGWTAEEAATRASHT